MPQEIDLVELARMQDTVRRLHSLMVAPVTRHEQALVEALWLAYPAQFGKCTEALSFLIARLGTVRILESNRRKAERC